MQLNEIFGRGKKDDKRKKLTPDEIAELEQQRRGQLRQMGKPAAGEKAAPKIDAEKMQHPDQLNYTDYLKWVASMESAGKVSQKIGPKAGDTVMTNKGAFTIKDPSQNGEMVAVLVSKDGKQSATVNWTKLNKPVQFKGKQYFTYGK